MLPFDHNGAVNDYKFLNQFQPQTLVSATMLCYIDAHLACSSAWLTTSALLAVVDDRRARGFGGFGIANEKKWGYRRRRRRRSPPGVWLIAVAGSDVLGFPLILNLVFDGALVALLLHPQSRDYQRIWFK